MEQEIFVVNSAYNALLGRPAFEALAIVKKVDAMEATDLKAKFPGIIKLKPDAKSFALSTPSRVPAHILTKVKDELSQM